MAGEHEGADLVEAGFDEVCRVDDHATVGEYAACGQDRPAGDSLGGAVGEEVAFVTETVDEAGLFDERIGFGPVGKLAWMFVGGLFIGFGTRLGNGCTSGHGIFGMSNFERSSFVTTLAFMAGGIAMTNLIYRVIF